MKTKKVLLFTLLSLLVLLVSCGKKKPANDIFEQIYESINLPAETITDLSIPTESSLEPDANLYWTSDNYRIISPLGKFRRPDEDTTVNLELMITIGTETKVYQYQVKAKGWEDQTLNTEVFKDPAGFASLGVTDRSDLSDEVLVANNEIEFLDHLLNTEGQKDVVIKITNDLNMGAKNIEKLLIAANLWDGVDPKKSKYLDGKTFRENTNKPTLHPTLLSQGVGQLIIDDRDGLMIYSETGVTIDHLTTHIKGNSKNIVFRNLNLQSIWEWDEIDRGDYKALDWDYFTIEQAENIWLDHLSFKASYDGIVDVKGGTKNITMSWLNLDFVVDEFIQTQFDWLEKNQDKVPFYRELRQDVAMEDIATIAAGQKKAFNLGNTEAGPGFESITVTMHNIYAKNLQDRFPRLRRGDVHVYNVVLDAEELQELKDDRMKVISQGIIPTEEGAIFLENSRFQGVNEPIKTHQSGNLDPSFTGRYYVKDSEFINKDVFYSGSSTDDNYDNPWQRSNYNIDYDLDFYFRNYENVPYSYNLHDANKLTKIFSDNLVGAGEIKGFNWLEIKNQVDPSKVDKGMKIDQTRIEGLDIHIAQVGDRIPTFSPKVYNYYTDLEIRSFDFGYYIDSTRIDRNNPGVYELIYSFYLTKDPTKTFDYKQTYVVYKPDGANEIYESNIASPFDNVLDGSLNIYEPNGTMYYLLSNSQTHTSLDVVENGISLDITDTIVTFENLDVSDYSHIHFVVDSNDILSTTYSIAIAKERIIEIKTPFDFAHMLSNLRTKGIYYKLINDIDFTDYELPYLTADNVFEGVFDGQFYSIKNINRHAYGGGIFHTIGNGKIKNVTFDNILIDIHETDIISDDGEVIGKQKTSARSGIVAGQIKGGLGILENITIKDSEVKTQSNYGAILVGKVEAHSSAIISNIKVYNSKVDQDGEYAGGLIAGVSNHTETLIEDIYINGLTVREGNEKMIGMIVGRMEAATTIRRVVVFNGEMTTNAAVGGVLAKDDRKGQEANTYLSDIFINITANTPSHYLGNIIGNPDVNMGHPTPIMTNIWGTSVPTGSSGLSADVQNTVELEKLDQSWWELNFENLLESNLWEIQDGVITLK